MADQVKVFHSGVLGVSDLQNGNELVVLETDATTKAVVKDVIVDSATTPVLSGGSAPSIELYNDTIKLADYTNASGSEIIDTNSKLYYKLTPTPTVSGTLGYSTSPTQTSFVLSTSSVSAEAISPTLKNDLVTNYTAVDTTTLIKNHFDPSFTGFNLSGGVNTVPGMSNPNYYVTSSDGTKAYYFVYDGNSSTQLRYSPAVNHQATGSWTTITNNAGYQYHAIDSETRKICSNYSSTKLVMHDIETNTQTTKSVNVGAISTYSAAAACKGYFFCYPSNGANSFKYTPIDTTTTTVYDLYINSGVPSGSFNRFAVCYNPNDSYYYFLFGYAGGSYYLYRHPLQSFTDFNLTFEGDFSNYFGQISNFANRFITGDHLGNFYLAKNDGTVLSKINMFNNTATVVEEISAPGSSYTYSGWVQTAPSSYSSTQNAIIEDVQLDIKCKVSGVEITGV